MGYSQRDCQNGRNRAAPAKMAARANLVPNFFGTRFANSKYHATKNFFSTDFFCLTFKFPLVKCRYKEKEKERELRMFALRFDGFVQSNVYATLEAAVAVYRLYVKSGVYQYDLAIVRIDENRKTLETFYPS